MGILSIDHRMGKWDNAKRTSWPPFDFYPLNQKLKNVFSVNGFYNETAKQLKGKKEKLKMQ